MTKKRARKEGAVTIDRLKERCRGAYLKRLIDQIAPAITALGYDSFNDKTPCMIGSHNIVTLELPDECLNSPECGNNPAYPFAVSFWVFVSFCFGSCSILGPA